MDAFRFSISWARLIPSKFFGFIDSYIFISIKIFLSLIRVIYVVNSQLSTGGKLKDGVNKEGVQFYKDLIDELLANGRIIILLVRLNLIKERL